MNLQSGLGNVKSKLHSALKGSYMKTYRLCHVNLPLFEAFVLHPFGIDMEKMKDIGLDKEVLQSFKCALVYFYIISNLINL